ncbi:MAG: phosphate ABC transporter permease PstA [Pseudomonadota bacterium]
MTDVIDFTELSAKHTSQATKRRLRARHWAEVRLKAYGILAIGLAGAALLLLVSTIVTKTTNVVYEYTLALETKIEVSDRDMERINDPNPNIRASLRRPIQDALTDAVPGEVGRRESRQLTSLVSNDAGLFLGDIVKADPSVIGQTIAFDALLDDNLQLYLKGSMGRPDNIGGLGQLISTPGDEEGTYDLEFEWSSFGELFDAIRGQRRFDAGRARAEQRRQQNAVDVTEERILDAATDEERARLQAQLESFRARRDQAEQRADALMRLATVIGEEGLRYQLTEADVSFLIKAGETWFKVTEIERGSATAVIYAPSDETGPWAEGTWNGYLLDRPESTRLVSDRQAVWMEIFEDRGAIGQVLNTRLLNNSDSASAELAGIWGAVVGSFWTMVVTFLLAFPLGVMASIYLEEFAPKNRVTDLIEVNINNLAAVPSIVFGLLGLAIFVSGVPVHLFGYDFTIGGFLPRSSPLAGGAVLALMTLPTIIIAGRASIRAVPPSIRDAALGLGASRLQTATHHVLPLAMPGILTGSIIGMAQALGETAPLLLVGMNSFIQEPPGDPLSPGNVLPTLIYQWNSNSERLFDDKTAAAISVLLVFLIIMNALAVLLRKRFERRW